MAVALAATPVSAAVITFENSVSSGGTLVYDGSGGPVVGTGITFDIVTFDDGSGGAVEESFTCVGCVLAFETGDLVPGEEGPPIWEFSAGGSFVITGQILDGATEVANGTLLEGSFLGAIVTDFGSGKLTLLSSGADVKHEDLLAYLGITNNDFVYANTEATTAGCTPTSTGAFDCGVEEADVTNTNVPGEIVDVPEPGLMLMFGAGLLGVGRQVRRRMQQRA